MAEKLASRKDQQKKLLKGSLLNLKNLCVLATGFVAGIFFAPILIPIGMMAYGILCYLDLSSAEFVKNVLHPEEGGSKAADKKQPLAVPPKAQKLATQELQNLQARIVSSKKKIQQLYDCTDEFTRALFCDFAQVESLVAKSDEFLFKAQNIRNYLASENVAQITQDLTDLQEKIQSVSDEFSNRQYQQALAARQKHLESLRDIQRAYERLVSQVTNISISLDSMYSRMMKLKTSEYSLASAESEQVSVQLNQILKDVEQLDTALTENLSLPK